METTLTSLSCVLSFCSFVYQLGLLFIIFGLRKDEIFSTANSQATKGGLASYCIYNLWKEALPGCKPLTSPLFVLLNIEQN